MKPTWLYGTSNNMFESEVIQDNIKYDSFFKGSYSLHDQCLRIRIYSIFVAVLYVFSIWDCSIIMNIHA